MINEAWFHDKHEFLESKLKGKDKQRQQGMETTNKTQQPKHTTGNEQLWFDNEQVHW